MSTFQNKSGPSGCFEAPIKNRNSRDNTRTKAAPITGAVSWLDNNLGDPLELTIAKANTIKLDQIFRHYGIDADRHNSKIRCPFKFHNDNTPSFQYHAETNSFFCWGCKNGGNPVNFVATLENISKAEAAEKLLDNFESEDVEPSSLIQSKEREDLYIRFSTIIRNFLKHNKDQEAIDFIDNITKVFDGATRHGKRVIDMDGLKHIINVLEKKIGKYECQ